MREELKPCPFCGEMPIFNHISDSLFDCGIFTFWIVCPRCGIRTQRNREKSVLIKVWNRRINDDLIVSPLLKEGRK